MLGVLCAVQFVIKRKCQHPGRRSRLQGVRGRPRVPSTHLSFLWFRLGQEHAAAPRTSALHSRGCRPGHSSALTDPTVGRGAVCGPPGPLVDFRVASFPAVAEGAAVTFLVAQQWWLLGRRACAPCVHVRGASWPPGRVVGGAETQ